MGPFQSLPCRIAVNIKAVLGASVVFISLFSPKVINYSNSEEETLFFSEILSLLIPALEVRVRAQGPP